MTNISLQVLVEKEPEHLPFKKIFRSFVSTKRTRKFSMRRKSLILLQMKSCKTFAELEVKYPAVLNAVLGDLITTPSYQIHKNNESIYKHHYTVISNNLDLIV